MTALDHREPDRVPIDLGGNQTGIHRLAYAALVEHLGLTEEIEIMDAVQQLARPSEDVLERLRVDTRYIHAGAAADFHGRHRTAERNGQVWHDLVDEFGVRWSMPTITPLYMDITHHPLADATLDDCAGFSLPARQRSGAIRRPPRAGLAHSARDPLRVGRRNLRSRLRNLLVYARAGTLVHGYDRTAGVLRGVDRSHAAVLDGLVRWIPGRGGRPGRCDHDRRRYRRSAGPLFQPDFYRSVVKPRHKRLVQYIKAGTNAKHLVPHLRRLHSATSPTCSTTASTP